MDRLSASFGMLLGSILLIGCGGGSVLTPPSNLVGSEMSGGFHLTWSDNSSDEEEFIIERQPEAGSYVEQARVPFNTTQYMVESNPGGMQQFRVLARKGTETSAPSNEVMWMP